MKKILLHLLCIGGICSQAIAQMPDDYYDEAHGKSGSQLKNALYNIIKDHIEFPYSASTTDTWDILKETDKDPNNSENVILIYSGRSVNGDQEYNGGSGWTREHVWAKSRGDFGTSRGAGTDVHHLRPLDQSVNSTRSNRAFDDCETCSEVIDGTFNTGSFTDGINWTFEPRSDVKGDVARMIFYMATRYEGDEGEPDLELTQSILGQSNKEPFHGTLDALLDWHRNDPVNEWERDRNDVIFNYQENRNPYIDFPELVEHIWGNKIGDTWLNPLSNEEFELENFAIYPNPASNVLYIDNVDKATSIELIDLAGRRILSQELKLGKNIISLPKEKGMYVLNIKTKNSNISRKIIKM
ncbi:endonuclease I family protein [Aureivirga marina]|uniref:endonuclease I family protein n=1 Tax=Aureivirga marina TaxID=1182451 RepID=UPI0018CAAA05|nr:endonuclease [Aureivirga marina]